MNKILKYICTTHHTPRLTLNKRNSLDIFDVCDKSELVGQPFVGFVHSLVYSSYHQMLIVVDQQNTQFQIKSITAR